MKNFLKELIITLLLIVAIVLILTVLFYDSIPINKVVPNRVTYTVPETLQEELDKNVEDEQEILVTYKVEEKDLDVYEENNSYNPGNDDPLGEYKSNSTPTTNVGGSNGGSSNNNGSETGNQANGSSDTGKNTTKPVVNK